MTRILISLSADGFKKGDRCVVKAGRGEWFVGTIRTSGAKLGIDFDDGAKATVDAEDFKDVKVVGAKAKKTKATLTTQEAKAFREKYPVAVTPKAAKVAKAPKVAKSPVKAVSPLQTTKPKTAKALKAEPKRPPNVPKASAAPVNKAVKTTAAFPPNPLHPAPGYVFTLSNQHGQFIVNDVQVGRVLTIVKYYMLNAPKGRGLWSYKIRRQMGGRMPYTYLRKATDAELDEAFGRHKSLLDSKQAIIDRNKEQGNALGIQIGDVVGIQYSNHYGLKSEIVTDINHKTGKVAISTWRERYGKKRRFIHMKNVKSIVLKGPGRYIDTNPIYTKF